jgi:hypothetical protein
VSFFNPFSLSNGHQGQSLVSFFVIQKAEAFSRPSTKLKRLLLALQRIGVKTPHANDNKRKITLSSQVFSQGTIAQRIRVAISCLILSFMALVRLVSIVVLL